MKKSYKLSGMSCGGCLSSVKYALQQHPDVKQAEVHLHPQGVELTMSKSINISELQARLKKAGNYTIMETTN